MPLRTLKCSVSECTRFCTPQPFSFQSADKDDHSETKKAQMSLYFETLSEMKKPEKPRNRGFSGKKEDADGEE